MVVCMVFELYTAPPSGLEDLKTGVMILIMQLRITEINYSLQRIHIKTAILNKTNILEFYCIFNQLNAALVSRKHLVSQCFSPHLRNRSASERLWQSHTVNETEFRPQRNVIPRLYSCVSTAPNQSQWINLSSHERILNQEEMLIIRCIKHNSFLSQNEFCQSEILHFSIFKNAFCGPAGENGDDWFGKHQ